jgi:hypothetical protein
MTTESHTIPSIRLGQIRELEAENTALRRQLQAERAKVKELSRCLSYAECPECSEYFIKDPRDCLLADHIEAYRAIIDDKPKGE